MWLRLVLICMAFATCSPSFSWRAIAQNDEEALIKAVQDAEAEVKAAEDRLNALKANYDPKITAYQTAVEEVDRLRDEAGRAYDKIDDAYEKVRRLPVSLSARRDALSDVLIRLYEQQASTSMIRQRERELEEVREQIRQFEQDNVPAKVRLAAARAEADRIWARLEAARTTEQRLRSDAEVGADRISDAEEELASARDMLERARSNARWRLNENAPPYLAKVKVTRSGQTFYDAEWEADEKDTEDLLKLAQYLHEDLGRTIPERQRKVDDWISFVEEDQKTANAAMRRYVDYMGGSYDGGIMGGVETFLDSISGGYLGAVVTGGVHPWKKIGVEIGDSALTIFRDTLTDGVPWQAAVFVELASQLGDAGIRAWRGESKNPSWDVTRMPYASAPVSSHRLSDSPQNEALVEKQLFDSITKHRVRASLERLRKEVESGLEGEDFRTKLITEYNGKTLAIALTETTISQDPPVLNFDDRNPISGSDPMWKWGVRLFTEPSGMMKTTMKTRFYEGFTGNKGTIGKDMFLDALQSAARDGLLEALERERLEKWYDWVMADADLQFSVAGLKNEGRLRRIDEKLRKILAEELIPELTREVESLRGRRTLQVNTDAGVTGTTAQLELEFSDDVVIDSLTLGDIELEPEGDGTSWTAEIDLEAFEEAQNARLVVNARHPALTDRLLDDPKTVASWSTQQSAFNAYEKRADTYHTIRLTPPEGVGYAIILDTSGSMDDNERMVQAKAAMEEFFEAGQIKEKDKIGLFTFNGCYVSESVPFTDDEDSVRSTIAGAGTYGDTPLAASIVRAADSLEAQNVTRGVLIVVTDGEDSCDGDVGAALVYAREKIDSIRRRLVR